MNATRSDYKGYRITTRWYELGPFAGLLPARFDACFKVDPHAPPEESWQEFPKGVFHTRESAIENALDKAKRSIDLALATPH
jgi:hypothetical protein